jgi:hypothetical protein
VSRLQPRRRPLAVVGDQDLVFDSRETQARILAHARHAEVMRLAGAGHGLIDCTAIIREFLVS